MKKFLLIIILSCGLTSVLLAESNIEYGPYLQNIDNQRVSIIIKTKTETAVTLYYKREGSNKWKTKTDTASEIHRFRLWGLHKGNNYEYYLTQDGTRLTQNYHFTLNHKIANSEPLRIAAVGDFGIQNTDQLKVITQMMQIDPDLILGLGDTAYYSGTYDEYVNNFFTPYQPILAEATFFGAMGNHETYTDSGNLFRELFEFPTSTATSSTEDYYSFDYSSVHFISLNSTQDYSVGSAMYNWLEQDLQAADEKWKILFMHYPPYSSGPHGNTEDMQDSLVPLFENYDVDIVLTGHDHDYERNNTVNGVLYLVSGGGGGSLYSQSTVNEHSAFFSSVYHFLDLTVKENTIKIKAINENGYVFDKTIIKK